jgi:N12 class adenine-specific DNA methylase
MADQTTDLDQFIANLPPAPDVKGLVTNAAQKYGLDEDLLHSMVQRESGYNPAAVSPKGAIGPMQLMPATAKSLGADPNDPVQNVDAGARYFRQLLDKYDGDTRKALAAYNAGPGRVDSGKPLPKETSDYVNALAPADNDLDQFIRNLPPPPSSGTAPEQSPPPDLDSFIHNLPPAPRNFTPPSPQPLTLDQRKQNIDALAQQVQQQGTSLAAEKQRLDLLNLPAGPSGLEKSLQQQTASLADQADRLNSIGSIGVAGIPTADEIDDYNENLNSYKAGLQLWSGIPQVGADQQQVDQFNTQLGQHLQDVHNLQGQVAQLKQATAAAAAPPPPAAPTSAQIGMLANQVLADSAKGGGHGIADALRNLDPQYGFYRGTAIGANRQAIIDELNSRASQQAQPTGAAQPPGEAKPAGQSPQILSEEPPEPQMGSGAPVSVYEHQPGTSSYSGPQGRVYGIPQAQPPEQPPSILPQPVQKLADELNGVIGLSPFGLIYGGVNKIAQGAYQLADVANAVGSHAIQGTPASSDENLPLQAAGGALKVLNGGMEIGSVLIPYHALIDPIRTVGTLAAFELASKGTEKGLSAAGVPQEYSELAGQIAGLGAGALAAGPASAKISELFAPGGKFGPGIDLGSLSDEQVMYGYMAARQSGDQDAMAMFGKEGMRRQAAYAADATADAHGHQGPGLGPPPAGPNAAPTPPPEPPPAPEPPGGEPPSPPPPQAPQGAAPEPQTVAPGPQQPLPPIAKGATYDTPQGTYKVEHLTGGRVIFTVTQDGKTTPGIRTLDDFRDLVGLPQGPVSTGMAGPAPTELTLNQNSGTPVGAPPFAPQTRLPGFSTQPQPPAGMPQEARGSLPIASLPAASAATAPALQPAPRPPALPGFSTQPDLGTPGGSRSEPAPAAPSPIEQHIATLEGAETPDRNAIEAATNAWVEGYKQWGALPPKKATRDFKGQVDQLGNSIASAMLRARGGFPPPAADLKINDESYYAPDSDLDEEGQAQMLYQEARNEQAGRFIGMHLYGRALAALPPDGKLAKEIQEDISTDQASYENSYIELENAFSPAVADRMRKEVESLAPTTPKPTGGMAPSQRAPGTFEPTAPWPSLERAADARGPLAPAARQPAMPGMPDLQVIRQPEPAPVSAPTIRKMLKLSDAESTVQDPFERGSSDLLSKGDYNGLEKRLEQRDQSGAAAPAAPSAGRVGEDVAQGAVGAPSPGNDRGGTQVRGETGSPAQGEPAQGLPQPTQEVTKPPEAAPTAAGAAGLSPEDVKAAVRKALAEKRGAPTQAAPAAPAPTFHEGDIIAFNGAGGETVGPQAGEGRLVKAYPSDGTLEIRIPPRGANPGRTAWVKPHQVYSVNGNVLNKQAAAAPGPAAPTPKPAPAGPIPPGHFMNTMDIDEAAERFKDHPVLSRATKFLADFRDETDAHSDGWPYWKLAHHAATQLMGMIQHPEYATEGNFKKALAPIKAFYTKRGNAAGMKLPAIAGETPAKPPKAAAPKPPAPTPTAPPRQTNALSSAADKARAELLAEMEADEPTRQSRQPGTPATPAPVDQEKLQRRLISLATIGAEHLLNGATTFPEWSDKLTADVGQVIDWIARTSQQSPDALLREVYQYAADVAKDFGVSAEPAPEGKIGPQNGLEQPTRAEDSQGLGSRGPGGSGQAQAPGGIPAEGGAGGGESGPGAGAVRGEGNAAAGGPGAGSPGVGEPAQRIEEQSPPRAPNFDTPRHERDYRIPDGRVVSGSPEARARTNMAAIRVLRDLQRENRPATVDEQHTLARYVGWGAVPQLFAGTTPEWRAAQAELKEILTPEEYEDARRSTTNAHYTSDAIVDSVWKALQHLGAKPGMSWLEPAVGVGNFFGRQPQELLEGARRMGLDKDTLTGAIAHYLYPDSGIDTVAFEKAELPTDYFDGAVSNVPFGDFGVHDPAWRNKPFLTNPIHNYFFAKSLTVVRPGGMVAFVTSRYTMDGYDKPHVAFRQWVADRADLLGAVRLPTGAFRQSSGTDVITDILFLRRRLPGAPAAGNSWAQSNRKTLRSDLGSAAVSTNEYFQAHPEMVLGEEGLTRGQFSMTDYNVKGALTPAGLDAALARMEPGAFQPWSGTSASKTVALRELGAGQESKTGALFFTKEGGLFRKTSAGAAEPVDVGPATLARVKGQMEVRDWLARLIDAEVTDQPQAKLDLIRQGLNLSYDRFVAEYGRLSSRANQSAMSGDPDAPLLVSLERRYDPQKGTAEKAKIFTERVLEPPRKVEKASNARDALYIGLNETGHIDWDRMGELTGKPPAELQQELREQGLVFKDPTTKVWQLAEEYLSGSVRGKLDQARRVAKLEPEYESNVRALEAVQPDPIPPGEIRAALGVTWVPRETYSEFVNHVLDRQPGQPQAEVHYVGGEWSIDNDWGAAPRWSTAKVGARTLLKDALNLRRTRVTYWDNDLKREVTDTDETVAARAKQQELQKYFEEWLFSDPERGDRMAKIYNDLNNDLRLRTFDGSHLTLPGMSRAALRGGDLEAHQKAAVWRGIVQPNALLAHAVGTGKTFEMIAIGMELKRLGLIRRPMYNVPNATLGSWQDQFASLYPQARVLVFSEDDLSKQKRQQTLARIQTGEWDAVVIPKSAFQKIRVGDEIFQAHYDLKAAELEEQIREAEGAGLDSRFIKRLEKAKERLLDRLQYQRAAERQDQTVSWEQLGIDQLFVDESHAYKKLGFATKQPNIAGIDQNGNQSTFDLYMKMRHVQSHGRGVIFATGTPVTNTMGELFSIMRYLIEPELQARGMGRFDEWAANFGRTVDVFEPKVEGGGYQLKSRFAQFVNLPELAQLFRSFADVVTADMVKLPIPELAGGERQAVMTELTEAQEHALEHLRERAASIRKDPRKAMPDNMLAVYTDAQKLSMDLRMLHPGAEDDPHGRLNAAADRIYRIWKDSSKVKGTQLVFSDFGKPEEAGGSRAFSPYDELIRKLKARGIPANEIAHVYQAEGKVGRDRLFAAVNDGRIRVLLGSTEKMGVGVNVQTRLIAEHHLDIPHRPDQLEQREGRILRQGNQNPTVQILYYLTRKSLDEAKMGNVLRKAKFINQVMQGKSTVREAEDLEGMVPSLEQFQAMTSGDPRILRKLEVDTEVDRLGSLNAAWRNSQWNQRREIARSNEMIESKRNIAAAWQAVAEARERTGARWEVGGHIFEGPGSQIKASKALYEMALRVGPGKTQIGSAFGTPITVIFDPERARGYDAMNRTEGQEPQPTNGRRLALNPYWWDNLSEFTEAGLAQSIAHAITSAQSRVAGAEEDIASLEREVHNRAAELAKPWPYQQDLEKLLQEQHDLQQALTGGHSGGDDAALGVEEGDEIVDPRVGAQSSDEAEGEEPARQSRPNPATAVLTGSPGTPRAVFRHGAVWVNDRAMQHIDEAAGTSNSIGLYLPPAKALEALNTLRSNPRHQDLWKAISRPLRDAVQHANATGRPVMVVRFRPGMALEDLKTVLRHERQHAQQPWQGSYAAGRELLRSPLAQKAAKNLGRSGYDPTDNAEMWAEIGAHLAAGPLDWEKLGLTRTEAKALFLAYLHTMNDETVANLRHIAPQLHQEVHVARQQAAVRRYGDRRYNPFAPGEGQPAGIRQPIREPVSGPGESIAASRGQQPVLRAAAGPAVPGQGVAQQNPALRKAAEGLRRVNDEVLQLLAPAAREGAQPGAMVIRHRAAEMAQRTARAEKALEDARDGFRKMPEADRWAWFDRVENGIPDPDPTLESIAKLVRGLLDGRRADVQALGTGKLQKWIENYMPHAYEDPKRAGQVIGEYYGKRPMEGSKAFLKKRKFETIADGMAAGLKPISDNPMDLVLYKLREMDKYIMAHWVLRDLKDQQQAQYVSVFKDMPPGWTKIDDRIGTVYGPPAVTIREAYDAQLMERLESLAASLGVPHHRRVSIGGSGRLGYTSQGGPIVTKFAGPESVLIHEIGHQLEFKFKLWDRLMSLKYPNRAKELRALADLRYEGSPNVSNAFKKYVRERDEQIANAIAALVYAPERFKEVAPNTWDALRDELWSIPAARPLFEARRSMTLGTREAEVPVGGMVTMGHWAMPEPVARLVNNYLSPGLSQKLWYQLYRQAGNSMNNFTLGFSAFHLGFTSIDAATSGLALGFYEAAHGHPIRGLVDALKSPLEVLGVPLGMAAKGVQKLAKGAAGAVAPLSSFARGDQLLQEYFRPGTQGAQIADLVQSMILAGGRATLDKFYQVQTTEKMMDAFHRGGWGILTGALRIPFAAAEQTVRPILEYIVPRQKLGVFAEMAQFELDRLQAGEIQAEDLPALLARAWDSVDNRLGQMVYDNLFWNKTWKDLLMASIRSVGWNTGTIREILGGAADARKLLPQLTGGGPKPPYDPDVTHRLSYLFALPLMTMLFGSIYFYLRNGHGPESLADRIQPRSGHLTKSGDPERMNLPTYTKDIIGVKEKGIWRTAKDKIHPLLGLIADELSNKDWRERPITLPDDPWGAWLTKKLMYALQAYVPMAVKNLQTEEQRHPEGLGERIAPFVGVTPAPAPANRMLRPAPLHMPPSLRPARPHKPRKAA